MGNNEILKLAGAAVGVEVPHIIKPGGRIWNPLENDGDAMRVLNDLGLNVFHISGCAYAMPSEDDGSGEQKVSHRDAGDKHAAMRLAIVRAAAEIGKGVVTPNMKVTGAAPTKGSESDNG